MEEQSTCVTVTFVEQNEIEAMGILRDGLIVEQQPLHISLVGYKEQNKLEIVCSAVFSKKAKWRKKTQVPTIQGICLLDRHSAIIATRLFSEPFELIGNHQIEVRLNVDNWERTKIVENPGKQ